MPRDPWPWRVVASVSACDILTGMVTDGAEVRAARWWQKARWGLICIAWAGAACGGRSASGESDDGTPRGGAGHAGGAGSNAAGAGGGSAGTPGLAGAAGRGGGAAGTGNGAAGLGGGSAGASAGQPGTEWDLSQGPAEVREACTNRCARMPVSCLSAGDLCRESCILSGNGTPSCAEDFVALIDCLTAHVDREAVCDAESCSGATGCAEEAELSCRREREQPIRLSGRVRAHDHVRTRGLLELVAL